MICYALAGDFPPNIILKKPQNAVSAKEAMVWQR
jgi:hypothetical protein